MLGDTPEVKHYTGFPFQHVSLTTTCNNSKHRLCPATKICQLLQTGYPVYPNID